MEELARLIDIFLHLDAHLTEWAGTLGPWLYVLLFLIIFCETGLVVTPFLPGDSLLFAAGALCALDGSPVQLPQLTALLLIAAVSGDALNYAIGAYLGPAEKRAELPELEWLSVPAERRYVSRWLQDCNYAQALEGEIDESHVGLLHRRFDAAGVAKTALTGAHFREDTAPRYTAHETPYGLACGARRNVEGGQHLWRINLFLWPCYTLIPPSDDPHSRIFRAWVPADDTHTNVICATWRTDGPVSEAERAQWRAGEVAHRRLVEGTVTPVARADNEYLIDREAQRTQSFTGIAGIRAQDAMVTESAGAIVDRTREHLGTSDKAVIAFRRRLLDAARRLAQGIEPQAPYDPDCYRVRAHAALVPRDERDFPEHEEFRRAMLAP